jgi:N-acetylmuramoyl-L-alanine amidase
MNYDANDLASMELCIWKEARGELDAGMEAVANVIANRIGKQGFPATLHDVIYQKNAFTSMSIPTDPEFNLEPSPGDQQFLYCQSICAPILNDAAPDPTHGALYYADLRYVTSGWFKTVIIDNPVAHPLLATIGRQSFYG